VLTQQWQDTAWANMFKDSSAYDGNDVLIQTFSYGWTPTNEWVATTLRTYTYDANGNEIKELVQKNETNAWVNLAQTIKTYDDSNRVIQKLYLSWEDMLWQNGNTSGRFD
jgi:hypothetical protein